jgi:hypothetical protein
MTDKRIIVFSASNPVVVISPTLLCEKVAYIGPKTQALFAGPVRKRGKGNKYHKA